MYRDGPGQSGSGGSGGSTGDEPGAGGAAPAGPPLLPPTEPTCGDGLVNQAEEECDTAPVSCVEFGFDAGSALCTTSCSLDKSACSGVEDCYDGRDNDGDGLVDCEETQECADACATLCSAPPALAEHASVTGSTASRTTTLDSGCTDGSGTALTYRIDATEDAKLDLNVLSSSADFSLSVASACGDTASELSCTSAIRLTLDVEAGETYFVTVQGASSEEAGSFTLTSETRQPACGDGIRDAHEPCDDGNIIDGDGCDPDCNLETSEQEPANDTLTTADAFAFEPWAAELRPAGDTDFIAITLDSPTSSLVLDTLGLGDGACGLGLMDTALDLYDTDANGNQLIATDDDSGDGLCARVVATGLAAGTYYAQVRATGQFETEAFPYEFRAFVGVCGNGVLTLGEECDDGNLASGDGCSATCDEES